MSNKLQQIVEACNCCLRKKKDLQIDTNGSHMYFKEFMIFEIYKIPIDYFCN